MSFSLLILYKSLFLIQKAGSLIFSANLANRFLMDRNRKNIRKSGNIKKPSMHLKQGYFFQTMGEGSEQGF